MCFDIFLDYIESALASRRDQNNLATRFPRYKDRLKTFQSWPKLSHLNKRALANKGFVYIIDRVQCVYCHNIFRDITETDLDHQCPARIDSIKQSILKIT